MGTIEQIIRPFAEEDVAPTAFVPPGTVGVPPVLVKIGLKGGSQTFSGKASYESHTKLGAVHAEASSSSQRINSVLGNPSGS